MSAHKFKEALELIGNLTAEDKKHKGIQQLFIETSEELGEFCRAYSIESGAFGKAHKKLDERACFEAVDLIICAYALQYYAQGQYSTQWFQDLVDESDQYLGQPQIVIITAISILGKASEYVHKPSILSAYMGELAVIAMALYRLTGGNEGALPEAMLKKLHKWENNQTNDE